MVRAKMIWLVALAALQAPHVTHGFLITAESYRIFEEDFESGTHGAAPAEWTGGGKSVQLVIDARRIDEASGMPDAPQGHHYLQMNNNPVPTGYTLRKFAPVRRGRLRVAWRMFIRHDGADQAGGVIHLRTSGPAEGRVGVSWNRVTLGQASVSHGTEWQDAAVPVTVDRWQTWAIDYEFGEYGQADDTWTLTVDGQTSAAFPAHAVGPADIAEILVEQGGATHDFFIDTAPSVADPQPADGSRPDSFGRHWVRRNPFVIMGLAALRHDIDIDLYRGAGFNTMFTFKDRPAIFEATVDAGMPYHVRVQPPKKGPVTGDVKANLSAILDAHPGATGIFMIDEPKFCHLENVREGNRWVKASFPHLLTYTNANPIGGDAVKYYGADPPPPNGEYSYEQYIEDVATLSESDVLSFDIYPFGVGSGHSGSYFYNLEIIRDAALRAGIPYWVIVQSFEVELGEFRRRLPSDSTLRMQVFSSLAYGFTGISYFCYDRVFERGLLEPDNRPNRLYYATKRINTELAHVGQALRFLTSRHALHVRGSHVVDGATIAHDPEHGTAAFDPDTAAPWLVRAVTIGEQAPGRDALLGLFEDDAGGRYFMLVNLWHGDAPLAHDDAVTFTVQLDTGVETLHRLSRETGRPEAVVTPGGVLSVTLPGGTGDLFKVGDGMFPGLGR